MSPTRGKLPRRLLQENPYQINEYFIWADSMDDAKRMYNEIELRMQVRPQDELVSGWFRYIEGISSQVKLCYYVRQSDYFNPIVWEEA